MNEQQAHCAFAQFFLLEKHCPAKGPNRPLLYVIEKFKLSIYTRYQ